MPIEIKIWAHSRHESFSLQESLEKNPTSKMLCFKEMRYTIQAIQTAAQCGYENASGLEMGGRKLFSHVHNLICGNACRSRASFKWNPWIGNNLVIMTIGKKRRKKVTEKGSGHSRNYSIFLAKLTFRKRNLYFNGDNAVTTNLL